MANIKSHIQIHTPTHTPHYIPILMPDEYWIGYLGRLLIPNGMKLVRDYGNINIFLDSILSAMNSDFINHYIYLKVATIAEKEIEIFTQQHSLIPFLRVANIRNRRPRNWAGEYKALAFRLIKKGVYFCKSCITEDINHHGYSYWRRSHQLPGINWCLKHGLSLSYVSNKNAMHYPPDTYFNNETYAECKIADEIKNNPIINKFTMVIQEYVENPIELNVKNLAKLLSQKATELNLVKNTKDNGKFISDFLIEGTPATWRNEHFPNLIKPTVGEFYGEFDYALMTKKPVKKLNILLVIASIFPSEANIFSEIVQHDQLVKKISETTYSEKEISVAYINNIGQINKIAKDISCCRKETLKLLINFGYYPLHQIGKRTIEALIAFNQGVPMRELVLMHDVNLKQLFLITHPSIKGMSEILNIFKTKPNIKWCTT